MKVSEKWLNELIGRKIEVKEISEILTSLGLETHIIKRKKVFYDKLLLGRVISIKSESTEKYSTYEIDIGAQKNIEVVKKTEEFSKGSIFPVFLDRKCMGEIKKFPDIICSRHELGLEDISSGNKITIPDNAPIGIDCKGYLSEHARVLDIDITHNRPDCQSVLGIVREICVAKNIPIKSPSIPILSVRKKWAIPISIQDNNICKKYTGRVIKSVNLKKNTPFWIQERLRCNNTPVTNSIYDIINYIALEIGEEVSICEFDAVKSGINIRKANCGEKIHLNKGMQINLGKNDIVISNTSGAISAVGVSDCFTAYSGKEIADIFIGSGVFSRKNVKNPNSVNSIKSKCDKNMNNSSQDFAIEYATTLILAIFGGFPGAVCYNKYKNLKETRVKIRIERVNKVLGTNLSEKEIIEILSRSGVNVIYEQCNQFAIIPKYRKDLNEEIDIVEEVARIYGYENIPKKLLPEQNEIRKQCKNYFSLSSLAALLSNRGYNEIFTYSFYANSLKNDLHGNIRLLNPMSKDMSVMRSDLLQGLLKTAKYNQNRKWNRSRLFEIGSVFHKKNGNYIQTQRLAVLASGNAFPEQWCLKDRKIDLHDAKLELECLFDKIGLMTEIDFIKTKSNDIFDDNESADILVAGRKAGVIGIVQEKLLSKMKILGPIYMFEIDLALLNKNFHNTYKNISRFPSIRRDISLVSPKWVTAKDIKSTVLKADTNKLISKVVFFDLYKGMKGHSDKKYISLGVIFQHSTRTLIDTEIDIVLRDIISKLEQQFETRIRGS